MQGVFCIQPKKLDEPIKELEESKRVLTRQLDRLKNVKGSLLGNMGAVKAALSSIEAEMEAERKSLQQLSTGLGVIRKNYTSTENNLIQNPKIMKLIYGDNCNVAFDDAGSYGGDQGSPQKSVADLMPIVKKYYPDFDKEQVDKYLKKLNSEGCGYVALANTVFQNFIGREDEFEKVFGFPMYSGSGDLNYDSLVTDLDAATDNHNEERFLWFSKDVVDDSEDSSATKGNGTSQADRKYRFEMYMKQHGIDVTVNNNFDGTADSYEELSKEGDVIVGLQPCQLYNEDGSIAQDSSGGHAMTVTGVADDGRIIVSSWGKRYYFDPNDSAYSRIEFQQIVYR